MPLPQPTCLGVWKFGGFAQWTGHFPLFQSDLSVFDEGHTLPQALTGSIQLTDALGTEMPKLRMRLCLFCALRFPFSNHNTLTVKLPRNFVTFSRDYNTESVIMYATFERPRSFQLPPLMTQIETIGDYVKRHRLRLGLKQEALAGKARISQSYVSGIERGVNVEIDAEIISALADALSVPRGEIQKVARQTLGFTENPPGEIEYIVNLDDLTPEGYEDYDGTPQEKAVARKAATEAARNTYMTVREALREVRRISPGTVPGAGPVEPD